MAAKVYHDGVWGDEETRLIGPMNHAMWMATVVFDGARAFNGLAPDLDLHCQRLNRSAVALGLKPTKSSEEIRDLAIEGIRMFPRDAELYIKPVYFARSGFVAPDPDSTDFTLAVYEAPMPEFKGFSACMSPYRRPARDMAPNDAKASCLYPNAQRALVDANRRGFDNAVMCDPVGNVAEFATANIWIVKDGIAKTPVWNGTFLNGVTRQRVIGLLREDGQEVQETTITPQDVREADEIFNTGNYGKVVPVTRFEDRDLQVGPVCRRARELYFDYAAGCSVY